MANLKIIVLFIKSNYGIHISSLRQMQALNNLHVYVVIYV